MRFILRLLYILKSLFCLDEPVYIRLYYLWLVAKFLFLVKIIGLKKTRLFGLVVETGSTRYFLYTFVEIFIFKVYDLPISSCQPCIFDVGAHIGLASLYFKRKYPQSRISLFEPEKSSYAILKRNLGQYSDLVFYPFAIDNVNERKRFYFQEGDPNSSLLSNGFKSVEVECRKLSPFVSETVDLLKMDVEGSELAILKELQGKFNMINTIVLEVHGNPDPIREFLVGENYEVRCISNFNNREDGHSFIYAHLRSDMV